MHTEILAFIDNAIDEDLVMFYNRFGINFTEKEFRALDDMDKEFLRDDLVNIIEESFEREMITAIKFYQAGFAHQGGAGEAQQGYHARHAPRDVR